MDALRLTRILKPPKQAIATFGSTTLHYVLLSMVPDRPDCCRLSGRRGDRHAQNSDPRILEEPLRGLWGRRPAYHEEIEKVYGEALRGLEYSFQTT